MLPSAQDALARARSEIAAAQEAQISQRSVLSHYRAAKKALEKADTKTDTASLRGVIAAFHDLAVILDHSGDQERANRCKQRAETLRQTLDKRVRVSAATIFPSLIGPGFSPEIAQAGAAYWGTSASSSSIASTAAALSFSAVTSVVTSPPSREPTPPSPPTDTPTSEPVAGISPQLFSKNLEPVPYICPLPGPAEPLQTARQLAYCLALLQPSVQKDDLSQEALEWRRKTLNNQGEKERLEGMRDQIIKEFAADGMKSAASVTEVVCLAPVLDKDHSRFLFTTFVDTINHSEILHLHSLEGLTKVIQGAAPGSFDSDDLVRVLESLHQKLRSTHSQSNRHRYHLLLAVSRVLDAMADAHIEDVHINLHGPLTELLRDSESESDDNPYLAYQAAYATQAMLNVSDNENIWRAGLKRGWLVLKGGAGFAKMPNPTEVKDYLEGLETLYEVGKGGTRLLKDALHAIRSHEKPTFTVKEGLKFRRAWYHAVRTAESYIQAGNLVQFKDLVTAVPCRHQLMFKWGICQLLGQFATDTQWDQESRKDAIVFLTSIYKDDDAAHNGQKKLGQVVFDVLTDWTFKNITQGEDVKSLLEEIRDRNATLKPTADLSWMNNQSEDPAPKVTLLKTVQDRSDRHAKIRNIPDSPAQLSFDDVRAVLKIYHAPDLFILRVSGKKLDMETCFVNLAIVEAPEHRQQEKKDLKEQAEIFHRIPSFERVRNADIQSLIPLEELFNKRKLHDEQERVPKTILVQGRAGIGKTTLCKKLVYAHQNGLWRDLFEIVLWIPLRQLRGSKSRTLESLFREKVFVAQDLDQRQEVLAKALAVCAEKGKVLFILDGLDEITTDAEGDEGKTFRTFLKRLLSQHHVVVTSRPSGVDSNLLPPIDLELETIGFSPKNVKNFLAKALEPQAVRRVEDFIQRTPLIQGLVNIPVQLDVICFSWDSLPTDGTPVTMTGLYQLMVWKLWCKDALRLKKVAGVMTERQIGRSKVKEINELMATELQHLGYLAFQGLGNNHQIEFDEDDLLSAFGDLEYFTADNRRLLSPQVTEILKQTSFLHTADVSLDSKDVDSPQAWHFLHLTFQEYFAATWIVRHFQLKQSRSNAGMMSREDMEEFVHQHKYNPQYEIVWSMVAGLLEGKPLCDFFGLLQGAPRDLIGGRHQQVLASCLNEARNQLDPAVAAVLDAELKNWLRFEMQTSRHDGYTKSLLGSRLPFPDSFLVETVGPVDSWKYTLARTLNGRLVVSDLAIQFLLNALKDADIFVRATVADALSKQHSLPEATIQSIATALKDSDWSIRSSAASILGRQYALTESAIDSIVAALKDENSVVRSSAASTLGKQSTLPESALRAIIDALRDDNGSVRHSAASILNNQSTLPESAIQSLIAILKNEAESVRSSAAWVLGSQPKLSVTAIQSLVAALMDEAIDVRCSAASALGKQTTLSCDAIDSLIAALMDNDWRSRSSAASALGKQSTLPESAIQSLITTLHDEVKDVRSSAASALNGQSTLPTSAIHSLLAILKEDDAKSRSLAAMVLGSQLTLGESAIQSLITALKDDDTGVMSEVSCALGNQSILSGSAVQALIATLTDGNWRVRSSALLVLSKQSKLPESTIQSLIDYLKDDDGDVRSHVVAAVGNQYKLPESAIQALIAAVQDDNASVKYSAIEALDNQSAFLESSSQPLIASLSDEAEGAKPSALALNNRHTLREEAIRALTAALKDKAESVRSLAAIALSGLSTLPESTISTLVTALEDDAERVRSSVMLALSKQPALSESAILSLIEKIKDQHPDIVSLAVSALSKQSPMSESAIQSLMNLLDHSNSDIRSSAKAVLCHQSTLPESLVLSLTDALKDKAETVRSSAAMVLSVQSKLPESSILSLIVALKDNHTSKTSAMAALNNQSTFPESVIQALIAALENKSWKLRLAVISTLGSQLTLQEAVVQTLVATLKDDDWEVRLNAASILLKHSIFPVLAIQYLITTLGSGERHIRNSGSYTLQTEYKSVCNVLPYLTEDELACLYENHLFRYSCDHVLSLQLRDNKLCFYTEQGPLNVGLASSDRGEAIASVFRAVQRKAGLL
ncbi:hypothetical protein EMPS_04116 [Entomortierella parvispora]|uniref:NACHT domain-containing protein n=1 Tax=Entomortierella parvispora TaxID=205924 RepID=A0A9P3H7V8_9FUNG|nr:hypothetical protein EMPS_04116 [Entomortierella parvispora]